MHVVVGVVSMCRDVKCTRVKGCRLHLCVNGT